MSTLLPQNWIIKGLGEISSNIQYGYTEKAKQEKVGPKFLRITDIQNDSVDWSKVPFCEIGENIKDKYLLGKNDLVFARTGATVGKSFLITGAFPTAVFASYLIRARLRPEVEPKYVSYFFRSSDYWQQISDSQAGIGQPNVNGKKLAKIEIPLAPFDQQKSIVAEIEKQFSRLDEAVANLKRVKANLKRYKAAVLKAAVEGKLTEGWRVEAASRRLHSECNSDLNPDQRQDAAATFEPASKLLERIRTDRRTKWEGKGKYKEPEAADNTDLPPLPKGWTWARLEQIGMIVGGLTKNPKRAKLTKKLPYLRVANVYANELRLEEIEHIGVQDTELGKLLLQKSDLLIVEGNGSKDQIGRLAIWDGTIDPCVHLNHLIKVRLVIVSMDKWILFWLLSPIGRHFIEEVSSSTSGLYTLSVNKVGDLPIIVPPLAEQEQIVAEVERRLSIIDELETTVEANLTRAERLRQAILQRAFAGQLVSQSLNEPVHFSFGSNSKGSTPVIQALESTKMTQHF